MLGRRLGLRKGNWGCVGRSSDEHGQWRLDVLAGECG